MNFASNWLAGFLQKIPPAVINGIIFVVTVAVLATTIPVVLTDLINPVVYEQGEVANYTVRAPRDLLIENTLETERRRKTAVDSVQKIFTINNNTREDLSAQLEIIFAGIQALPQAVGSAAADAELQTARTAFERNFDLDFIGKEWEVISDRTQWLSLEEKIINIASPILRKGIITNKRMLTIALDSNGSASLLDVDTNIEREITSIDGFYDLREAREIASASLPNAGSQVGANQLTPAFRSTLQKLVHLLLKPNVSFDSDQSEDRVRKASAGVETIYFKIKRGEVIVRAGDVVDASQARRLSRMHEEIRPTDLFRTWVGYFALSSMVILSVFVFAVQFWPGYKAVTKDIALMSAVLIGSFFVIKLYSILATSLANSFFYFDPGTFVLAAPIAIGGIMLQVILGAPAVFVFVLSFAMLSGVFLENSWIVLILIVVGNIVGAISVRECQKRSSFIWAGLRVAGINMCIVLCFLLLNSEFTGGEMASRVLWSIAGGLSSGILAAGLAPIAEYFGRYITDIKLLELASLDHPILRELSIQAPGTWNHSMVIGQMGESAAKAIGANALLTRVGAYYHDIGKCKKPAYFVENQTGENRHDKLTPSMSALIIKTHVKDGVEMAEKAVLPPAIIDFIPQHHGTALIEYFYEKAQREAEEDEVVTEGHYRYGGPKPQTKEAGILMLADGIEASSRTLSDPTPAKIQGLVQKMINKVFVSGELDESNLTLKDLHFIAKSFTRVLTGIYHRRIEYSEPAEKTRDSKASRDEKQSSGQHQVVDGKTVGKTGKDKGKEKTKEKSSKEKSKEKTKDKPESKDEAHGSRNKSETKGSQGTGESPNKKSDPKDSTDTLKRLGI